MSDRTRPGYEDSTAGKCLCVWDCAHQWCGCHGHQPILDTETRPASTIGIEYR